MTALHRQLFTLSLLVGIALSCAPEKSLPIERPEEVIADDDELPPDDNIDDPQPEDPAIIPARFNFEKLGVFAIDTTAVTEEIEIAVGRETGVLVLRAISDPAGAIPCFQLYSARTTAAYLVEPPSNRSDFGSYCVSCTNRGYLGKDYGLFILPNNGDNLPQNEYLLVRFQARNCLTGLAIDTGGEDQPAIAVELLRIAGVDATAPVDIGLSLVFTQASQFYGVTDIAEDEVLNEAVAAVQQDYDPYGIEIAIDGLYSIEAADPYPIEYSPENYGELNELFGLAVDKIEQATGRSFQHTIPVIFGGCLSYENRLLMQSEQPYGFVPRIPGGFSTGNYADAVFLRGGNCSAGVTVEFWFSQLLARVLSHELGHYLGLYHTFEDNNTTDHLDDTGSDNLMYYNPFLETSIGLSARQQKIIKSHPYAISD